MHLTLRFARLIRPSSSRDERPIDEQLTEGLDRVVHGKNMAATIQVLVGLC